MSSNLAGTVGYQTGIEGYQPGSVGYQTDYVGYQTGSVGYQSGTGGYQNGTDAYWYPGATKEAKSSDSGPVSGAYKTGVTETSGKGKSMSCLLNES